MNLWILLLCAASFAMNDNPFTAEGKRLAKKANPRHQPGYCTLKNIGLGLGAGLCCWFVRDYSCGGTGRYLCNYNYLPTISNAASGVYSNVPSLTWFEKVIDDKNDNKNDNNAKIVTFCGENAFGEYMFGNNGETYEKYCLEKYTTDCGKDCGEGDKEVGKHSRATVECKGLWSKKDCEKKTKPLTKQVVVGQDDGEGKNKANKNTGTVFVGQDGKPADVQNKKDKKGDNKNKDKGKPDLRFLQEKQEQEKQEKPSIRSASNKL